MKVQEIRPQQVLLMVGSNDLAGQDFRQQRLIGYFDEITLGMLAAGAQVVRVWLLPPRVSMRRGDVSGACYRRRRQLANAKLKHKFRREPVRWVSCPTTHMLGPDGVHPSRVGWQIVCSMVAQLVAD